MKKISLVPRSDNLDLREFSQKKDFYMFRGFQYTLPKLSMFHVIPYFQKHNGIYQITKIGKMR